MGLQHARGGPAAGAAVESAAALLVAVARASVGSWPDGAGVASQAAALAERARVLARRDAAAYATATQALREREQLPQRSRDFELGSALAEAAEAPLAIVEAAGDVVTLAALVASACRAELRSDAVAAGLLAEGAGAAAAHLVEINLATTANDARVTRAHVVLDAMAAERPRLKGAGA